MRLRCMLPEALEEKVAVLLVLSAGITTVQETIQLPGLFYHGLLFRVVFYPLLPVGYCRGVGTHAVLREAGICQEIFYAIKTGCIHVTIWRSGFPVFTMEC